MKYGIQKENELFQRHQLWIFGRNRSYELRDHFDHIGGMLTNMMNGPEKWCKDMRKV